MMSEQNNRVLNRLGARELSEEEVAKVNGSRSLPTNTVCTFPSTTNPKPDGDSSLGEC